MLGSLIIIGISFYFWAEEAYLPSGPPPLSAEASFLQARAVSRLNAWFGMTKGKQKSLAGEGNSWNGSATDRTDSFWKALPSAAGPMTHMGSPTLLQCDKQQNNCSGSHSLTDGVKSTAGCRTYFCHFKTDCQLFSQSDSNHLSWKSS